MGVDPVLIQENGKGGLSLRGYSSLTVETAITAETAKTVTKVTQNRDSCLVVLYFVGQAKGGQGALQNRRNRHEGLNSIPDLCLEIKPFSKGERTWAMAI